MDEAHVHWYSASLEDVPMSENDRKLRQAFALALNMSESDINEDLKYRSSAEWDSIAHMTLVAVLDETFAVTLEAEDVMDLSSYNRAREILTKYGIRF
jgi:acyl carrier protein